MLGQRVCFQLGHHWLHGLPPLRPGRPETCKPLPALGVCNSAWRGGAGGPRTCVTAGRSKSAAVPGCPPPHCNCCVSIPAHRRDFLCQAPETEASGECLGARGCWCPLPSFSLSDLFFPFHQLFLIREEKGTLLCVRNYLGGLKGTLIFMACLVPELSLLRQPLVGQTAADLSPDMRCPRTLLISNARPETFRAKGGSVGAQVRPIQSPWLNLSRHGFSKIQFAGHLPRFQNDRQVTHMSAGSPNPTLSAHTFFPLLQKQEESHRG